MRLRITRGLPWCQLLALALTAILSGSQAAWGAAVTVREPGFGLPHIYADTDLELSRENGREVAKDRLGQIILLGRVGRGTLYQAFGVLDASTFDDDVEARRTAYTSSELNNMYAKFPARERQLILEYCKGVNDTIDAIYAGTLPEPIEANVIRNVLNLGDDLFGTKNNISDQVDPNYAAPGGEWPNAGFQFTPEVFVAINVLEVRNFGSGGFDEASLLSQLQALIARHGTEAGTQIWDDRNFLNDPLAPVTVPDPTTPGYGGPLASKTATTQLAAAAKRFPLYDYAAAMEKLKKAAEERAEFATLLGAWPKLGSYAWVIGGGKSATGYPWVGGFPQTGIQTPSLMHFVENRSGQGTISAAGMEFAGALAVVLIGHNDRVAWTSTTAQLRVSDTFLEEVVNEDANALRYNDEGTPAPLLQRTETFFGGLAPTFTRVLWRSHERNNNGGSRPINDFLGDAEGTADGGTGTTLVDAGAFDDGFVGGYVALVDGTGAGQIRSISAVPNSDTLQVGTAWATTPDDTSVYVAAKPENNIIAVALDSPIWLEETTTGLGFSRFQEATSVLDVRAATRLMPSTHNFPGADNLAFNGIGTQSGNGNIAYYSSGFSRKRRGDPDPLDARLPMDGTSPDNPLIVASGVVDSATTTSLTASTSTFGEQDFSPPPVNFRYLNPTEQGSEFIVSITSGTGYKQTRRIASNTSSSLTIESAWGVTPASGDTFEVYEIVAIPEVINPSEGYLANWNNKAATADEGENFGRQFRHIFILERLAADNAWTRDKQRQLNKEVAGLDGKGAFGRFLIPRLRFAVDAVGSGGISAVDSVLAALESNQAEPFLGRLFIDPVTATTTAGEIAFLNQLINRMAADIYSDELAGAAPLPTGSRALNVVQHAIDSKVGDLPGAYVQRYQGDYFNGAAVDAFMCYKGKTSKGTPKFAKLSNLSLAEEFESGDFDLKKSAALCAPASLDGGTVNDEDTHLVAYKMKASKGEPKHVPQTGIVVSNVFGTVTLDTVKPDRLLVPSSAALGSAAAGLPSGSVDHYKCYKAKITKGTAKFPKGVQVAAADPFEDRLYDVKKPTRLCIPVDKNGEGINNATHSLVCYKAKPAKGEPKHNRVIGQIHTLNQFGAEQPDTVKEEELCVPPSKDGFTWEVQVRDSVAVLAANGIPEDSARPNSTYAHPLAALFPEVIFEPTPFGNRGTYEQIVDVGPVVKGEFIFPLGQSGLIEGSIEGVTAIDPNVDSLQPIWRDWRFVPMLRVSADLQNGTADSDGDGVFDGFERWYYGNLAQSAASDTDGDGASLSAEFAAGSDPTDADTDDDGVPDGTDAAPQDRLSS